MLMRISCPLLYVGKMSTADTLTTYRIISMTDIHVR